MAIAAVVVLLGTVPSFGVRLTECIPQDFGCDAAELFVAHFTSVCFEA